MARPRMADHELRRPRDKWDIERMGNTAPQVVGVARGAVWGEPRDDWTPTAVDLWEGLASSGHAGLAEPSDVAYARFVMGLVSGIESDAMKGKRPSAHMVANVQNMLKDLGATHVQRVQAGVTLERPKPPEPTIDWESATSAALDALGDA